MLSHSFLAQIPPAPALTARRSPSLPQRRCRGGFTPCRASGATLATFRNAKIVSGQKEHHRGCFGLTLQEEPNARGPQEASMT